MSILLALAVASSTPQPLIADWANGMTAYARPRLEAEAVEKIVEGGFASCPAEEAAVRRSYIQDLGPERGAEAFAGLRQGVRAIMLKRLTQAKDASFPGR